MRKINFPVELISFTSKLKALSDKYFNFSTFAVFKFFSLNGGFCAKPFFFFLSLFVRTNRNKKGNVQNSPNFTLEGVTSIGYTEIF